VFRLFTGADERRLPQLHRTAGDRTFSAMLGWRVLEVEGVPEKDKRRFLEDLSLRDADFLVDEFDRVDCGVDTAIEVECPECSPSKRWSSLSSGGSSCLGRRGRRSAGTGAALPRVSLDSWREGLFQLCWRQQGIAAVGAVPRATTAQLHMLRDAAIQAGIETRFSPEDAVAGLQSLATAGQTAEQATRTLIPVLDLAAGSLRQLGVAQARRRHAQRLRHDRRPGRVGHRPAAAHHPAH
jgi:hypothetical protein